MKPGHIRRLVTRCSLVLAAVLAISLVLDALDADLTIASIVLMLAVVVASTLGFAVGLVAALGAFVLLSYFFVSPKASFAVDHTDDLIALAAFVTVSLVVGAIVARLNDLRARAALAAREAELRVRVTNDLLAGDDTQALASAVCRELAELFDLQSCELDLSNGPPAFRVETGRPLQPYERATLDALEAGLTAAFDRERLDVLARESRVKAEVDRSRASFLAALTHDLRTPLATIKAANAALLSSDATLAPDERQDLLDASYREASRLEQLVTTALELTRIRSDGLRPEPVTVALVDLVRAATQRLLPSSSERDISLDISPELPAAYVDAGMLERAVANVLENALRYSPPDRPIEVSAGGADSVLELRIRDHGPGVSPPDRERVFLEFAQLDDHHPSGGVGLGLAITRAFVDANGGAVRCETTPGGGATFVLTMPAALEEEMAESERREPGSPAAQPPRAGDGSERRELGGLASSERGRSGPAAQPPRAGDGSERRRCGYPAEQRAFAEGRAERPGGAAAESGRA